ncbi:MAG TPA: glycosyltransferase family 9 protein [Candidatus Elarobacter sp.]|nr:glycosyltransferase family 9 protein [Candidatus Elarobacter sp.]
MASERALLVAAGGGIGDTLLAGVVARALRSRFAAVDAAVLPAHAELASHVPAIDRVIPFGARLTERYGAAIVTWATLGTALLPWRARIPVRVGQARRLYSGLFTHRVVVRSELGDRTTHWTQILLDYARAIGCDLPGATPEFAVRDDERQTAETLLRVHDVRDAFCVLHPTRGLSAQRSRWPVEGFVALAKRLVARDGVPLLVTGSPDDAEIAHAIADRAGKGVVSVAGATSIGVFGALAERARAVVAMDSGPMHVAAAAGAPTVGIFALQSDEPDRWAPKGRRVAIVRPTYPCPPAHRKETCPDFACVRALDENAVLAVLDGLLVATAER